MTIKNSNKSSIQTINDDLHFKTVPFEHRTTKDDDLPFRKPRMIHPGYILRITPVWGVVGSPMMDGTGKWTKVDGKRTPWHSYMTD